MSRWPSIRVRDERSAGLACPTEAACNPGRDDTRQMREEHPHARHIRHARYERRRFSAPPSNEVWLWWRRCARNGKPHTEHYAADAEDWLMS